MEGDVNTDQGCAVRKRGIVENSMLSIAAWGNGAVCVGAAIVAWRKLRKKGLALLLLGAGGTSMAFGSFGKAILELVKRALAQQVSEVLVGTVVQLTSSSSNMNLILHAVSEGIRKSMANDRLKAALKEVIVESMRYEELDGEIMKTMSRCMVVAARDKSLRHALLTVMTESLKEDGLSKDVLVALSDASQSQGLRDAALSLVKNALKDSRFMSDIALAFVQSGLSVLKDEEISCAMISMAKVAIEAGFKDEAFCSTLHEIAASSLRSGVMYRQAARGVVGALNPFSGRRKDELGAEHQEEAYKTKLKRPAGLDDYRISSQDSWGDFESCGYRTDDDGGYRTEDDGDLDYAPQNDAPQTAMSEGQSDVPTINRPDRTTGSQCV
eukprot:gnl/TRDRNA2_/TRDRNA2_28456_c0_seq1.p1 gnl/TRDRNA2_/TRDRNA2_28456_c0~~gnl/TRDRNA2_/TRDRNA2_28456_c0_seq1.p1  ORF type:complete len:395 (-),score=61.79 gnl/TRDRNA2_/TRDRNA2_28456_c0_seq1:97-1245(-)